MVSEEHVQELEIRLTFVDEAVSSLSTADAELSLRLAAIERMLTEMRRELTALRSAVGHDARDEPPPPHY
ncbi:MAG TPA: SlyX family protein [Rhodanobacteraceae bacterium]|nr:SlyX family protein [Rhodanobacteraceae bacterium]